MYHLGSFCGMEQVYVCAQVYAGYTCIGKCTHVYVGVCVYIFKCTHVHAGMYAFVSVHVCMQVCLYGFVSVHMCIQVCVHL